ncbi:MAG: putative adenylyltransferase/sulfurtransferase MoeZ [bacterium]|nr:putative adenylyltransferase/sulfurtransferase MoeZ [bacterium]
MELSREQIERYSRHLILPEIAVEGQKRLLSSRVLLIGTGGLGSPLALYLGAAGVGKLGLVDFDVVDRSNLQRQVIHGLSWLGKPKVESAKARIADLNPDVQVEVHREAITSKNALEILREYDVVIDGTDNFPTRYLTNDACALLKKPNIYGSIFRFDGQATVFDTARGGPCYRCLYPEPPPPGMVPSCAEGGVLGILPGIIGLIQATECIKILLGIGSSLVGRLIQYDSLAMKFRELKLRRDPNCPLCGDNPTIHELIDYEQFCGIPKPDEKKEEQQTMIPQITAPELKAKLDAKEDFLLLDVREQHEYDIARIPGATLLPLSVIQQRVGELEDHKGREIVIHCKMGGRSMQACQFLQSQGFSKVVNVAGGITAWSDQVDPSVAKY